jgi:hypothetical protein
MHCNFGIDLINQIKLENPHLWTESFKEKVHAVFKVSADNKVCGKWKTAVQRQQSMREFEISLCGTQILSSGWPWVGSAEIQDSRCRIARSGRPQSAKSYWYRGFPVWSGIGQRLPRAYRE